MEYFRNDDWHCSKCYQYNDPQYLDYITGLCWPCQDDMIILKKLAPGTKLEIETVGSSYMISVLGDNKFRIQGGRYYPEPCDIGILSDELTVGSRLNLQHPDPVKGILTTSPVKTVKIIGPENRWEYTLP